MASSFIVRSIDPAHEPALRWLRQRYGTTAISTAISRLLDDLLQDNQRAAVIEARERELVAHLAKFREQDARRKDAERQMAAAMKDATAIAKQVADKPRQLRISDGYE